MRQIVPTPLTPEDRQPALAGLAALRRQRDARLRDYVQDRAAESDALVLAQSWGEIDLLDGHIADLAASLERPVPRELAERPLGAVGLGARVTVRWDGGDEATYTIVGSLEVDPGAHRISYESPVGRVLLGRRAAEWIEVATPARRERLLVVAVGDGAPASGG